MKVHIEIDVEFEGTYELEDIKQMLEDILETETADCVGTPLIRIKEQV